MKSDVYYKNEQIDELIFPNAGMRHVAHMVRDVKPIPNYRAIVDKDTDRTFAIVKSGYKILKHEEVIRQMDELCTEFPEYGKPTREIWMGNHGGRMKTRWTFNDIDFVIGNLPDGKPDIVHPTMEAFASYDTSLAQQMIMGGFRTVCSNGMIVGKILAKYKKKHTASLDIERARMVLTEGMRDYSDTVDLWLSYAEREAELSEINCYDALGFNADEKRNVEAKIKSLGKVKKWDDEEPDNRVVSIDAWTLLNIFTEEATHRIPDVNRQLKVQQNISKAFA